METSPQDRCIVCNKAAAPYRFKCCGRHFCSIECHARHDQQECQPEPSEKLAEELDEIVESDEDSESDLTPEEISKIRTNEALFKYYESSKIRDYVQHIIQNEAPRQILETAWEDPEFRDFCDLLVATTGRL